MLFALRAAPRLIVWVLWVLTIVGNGWGLLTIVPFLFSPRTRKTAMWMIACQAAVSVVVSAAKEIIDRQRPCEALAWCEAAWIHCPKGGSLPSGHAAGAFAFAVFASVIDWRFAPLTVPIAALIALSRCVLSVHYPSDVVAGAMLGSLFGYGFARLCRRS